MRRRDFLAAGASAAMLAAVPRPLMAYLGPRPEPAPPIEDPRLKSLAFAAVEAAKAAGANYADARLTHTWEGEQGYFWRTEHLSIGVRALVNGYWGFAASGIWSPDEAARLGREAVGQARTNALGKPRHVELAPVPVVRDGHWETPIVVDPMTVPASEMADYISSLTQFATLYPDVEGSAGYGYELRETAFASSLGSYCTQRLCQSEAVFSLRVFGEESDAYAEFVFPFGRRAGVGWEYIRDREAELRAAIPRLIEEARAEMRIPVKGELDVGRYDTVFDAKTVAAFLTPTIGYATELDRALGYEANAGGTSYLTDPVDMLGSFEMAAPLLTVHANRSAPHGLATVGWDDEAVKPDDFTLVKDGVLNDFLTHREGAGWLKDAYSTRGQPFSSHGCAAAPKALYTSTIHVPNLVMAPGDTDVDFDDLVSGMKEGLALRNAFPHMDFQQRTGMATPQFLYEVRDGKRVARIAGPYGFLFRVPELWKSISAIGGPKSAAWFPGQGSKGEPTQMMRHSVSAVPVVADQVTFLDVSRKA